MNWDKAKDMLLVGLAFACSGFIGVELRSMRTSVEELNKNVAVAITNISNLNARVTNLENRQ